MPMSWEMASGPTVGYNMAGQGSTCVAVESPKGSAYSNFRVQDSVSRSVSNSGDASKGANYRIPSSHDTVVRGLSGLSLRGQYDADSVGEESRSGPLGPVFCAPPELYRCLSPKNNESSSLVVASASVWSKSLGQGGSACGMDFIQCNGLHEQASSDENGIGTLLHMNAPHRMALSISHASGADREGKGFLGDDLHAFHDPFWCANTHEDKHREDVDLDAISESLASSEDCMPVASSSSGETSQVLDDTEAQSSYKETTELSRSVGTPPHPRKGLSRFYAGKSQSFSCLRDVVSVKDLAKPESPYARKRRVTSASSRLPPLQKNSSSITKKPLQNGKSTLALAVAMSTKDETESQTSAMTSRYQESLVPTRSYSLSDLQGAGGSLFFIG